MWLIPLGDDATQEERWAWFMEHFSQEMEKQLYYEAYRILHSREEAEEALQEAIIRGAMHLGQLKEEDKLYQWMFSILRYEAYARRRQHLRAFGCILHMATGLGAVPSLEERLMSRTEAEQLSAMVENLGAPDKDIIRLRIAYDMPLKDIARRLGMNYQTVRSRYRRALLTLKQMLGE